MKRLLSKLAAGRAGEGAAARRKDDFQRVSMDHTAGREAAGSTAEGSPKGVSLAGAGELLLDASSTEATLSCAAAVEFSKLSIFENIYRLLSKLAAGRAGEGAAARR
jgi:hypothetical protein